MTRSVAIPALVGLVWLLPTPAGAVYKCGDQKDDCQCKMNNPYPCCSNGGNCTWWAWEAACCNWKVGLPGWGNANQWAGNARAHPSYTISTKPVPNSVGVRVSGSYGHVVWVRSVSGSSISVSEMNCWGNYGMRHKTYSASYFDGGFIVRKNQCACSPGKKDTRDCGACGKQTRTCSSTCAWGSWGSCTGQGACSAGKKDTRTCGNCGKQTRTCSSTCAWGSWGSCTGQGACKPGTTEQRPCGSSGSQRRTCTRACAWGQWGTCQRVDAGPGKRDAGKGKRDAASPTGDGGASDRTLFGDLPTTAPTYAPPPIVDGCAVSRPSCVWPSLLVLLVLTRRRFFQ